MGGTNVHMHVHNIYTCIYNVHVHVYVCNVYHDACVVQVRHGAATAIRGVIKHHGDTAGLSVHTHPDQVSSILFMDSIIAIG